MLTVIKKIDKLYGYYLVVINIFLAMDIQFNDLSEPDPNVLYYCAPNRVSSGFSYLMKLVLMVRMTNYQHLIIPLIENIIKDKSKINEQNSIGFTPLIIACINSNTYSNNLVVKMLIDAGANINIAENHGWSALMMTCIISNSTSGINTIKMLIDAGADVNAKDNRGATALIMTSFNRGSNNIEIVKMLIGAGANINSKSDDGYSALMTFCINAHKGSKFEIVKLLIDAGANINNVDNRQGWTALTVANKLPNNTETILLLINAGSNVNIKYEYERTFLMLFLIKEYLDDNDTVQMRCSSTIFNDVLIKLLHVSKETLFDTDDYGKTAYDYYIEYGYNILDEYHLKILKGDIHLNCTKSARR